MGTSHHVDVVRDGASALTKIRESEPYDVLLLDWVMPQLTGVEVCRQVRAMGGVRQPHISLVSAKNLQEEAIEGLSSGADDFIPKPISVKLLLGRLAAIARWRAGAIAAEPAALEALRAAVQRGDGELIVASEEVSARIFVHNGRIAWVHLSEHPDGLLEVLHNETALKADDVREVILECRRTGSRLTDTLLAFGLLDRATLRVALLGWMQRQLQAIFSLPRPRTLFVPKKRTYAEELLFELDELVPPASFLVPADQAAVDAADTGSRERKESIPPPAAAFPQIAALLENCAAIQGIRGATVFDRYTGASLGPGAPGTNPDVAAALLHAFNVMERQAPVDDLLIVSNAGLHIVQAVDAARSCLLYVIADGDATTLAMVRIAIRNAIAGVGDEGSLDPSNQRPFPAVG